MADDETFYEVLSVAPDASRERIQQAYREQVKEHHPDVSDAPDTRERFKRITRAKSVLTDRRERRRYDRLGHEAYLERERSGRTHRSDDAESESPGRSSGSTTDTAGHGPAAGSDAQYDPTDVGSTASGDGDEREQTTHGGSGPGTETTTGGGPTARSRSRERPGPRGEPMHDAPQSPRTDEGTGPLGGFAVREVVAAAVVGVTGGASVALAFVPHSSRVAAGVLLASWVIVSAVAGRLATRSAPTLPADVVRAQAFPLVLFVVAWYVYLGTAYRLLAVGLAAYGLFAAVFRTAALASGRRSALRAASLWFVASTPAAVVGYVTLTEGTGVLGTVTAIAVAEVPGPLGGGAVLAVAAAVVVVFGHALWRLGRALG